MNERPTDNGGRQAVEEVHSPAEAGDLQRMGIDRKRGDGMTNSLQSFPMLLDFFHRAGVASRVGRSLACL